MCSQMNEREKAQEICDYVKTHVRHDYHIQPDTFDPEQIMKLGHGRCGHRAIVFHHLATHAGLKARRVIFPGHQCNEVLIDGEWIRFDTSVPTHRFEALLLDIIKQGPIATYDDGVNRESLTFSFGDYWSWLEELKKRRVRFLLPCELLEGRTLDSGRPNVIIRHDVDFAPLNWLSMVREELQLQIPSVTYVRVDDQAYSIDEYAPMFQLFEGKLGPVGCRYEVGLHVTAVDRHDLTFDEAYGCYEEQKKAAAKYFNIQSVQAHGFSDVNGVPSVTNYTIDDKVWCSFTNILKRTKAFKWRIADSGGVLQPSTIPEAISRMENGALYYCLFHPDYYECREGRTWFTGVIPQPFTMENLHSTMPRLNQLVKDTPYFNHVNHPHLVTAAGYLRFHMAPNETLIDLACGWATLALLLKDIGIAYVGIEKDFNRVLASEKLCMSLQLPTTKVHHDDLMVPKVNLQGDWVVFIGGEGDASTRPLLDQAPCYLKPQGRLLFSYIRKDQYDEHWAKQFPPDHYWTMSKNDLTKFMERHNLTLIEYVPIAYDNKFPREIAVAKT